MNGGARKLREQVEQAFGRSNRTQVENTAVFEGFQPRLICKMPLYATEPPDINKALVVRPGVGAAGGAQRTGGAANPAAGPAASAAQAGVGVAAVAAALRAGLSLAAGPAEDPGTNSNAATGSQAAPAATASATPPSQPQFADDDPDSPFYIHTALTKDDILLTLDQHMIEQFKSVFWADGIYQIPPAPTTAAAAAKLQGQINELLAAGRLHESFPWQCQMCMYSLTYLGDKHPATLQVRNRIA